MPKFSLRGPRDWRLRGRKNLARLTAPEQPTNLIGVGSRYLHGRVAVIGFGGTLTARSTRTQP